MVEDALTAASARGFSLQDVHACCRPQGWLMGLQRFYPL